MYVVSNTQMCTAFHPCCVKNRYLGQGQVITLQWRHNGRDSVSNHQPYDCLLNRLFRRRSNKASKLRVTGLCAGNSPGTGEFPAQMASNAENVSIWWRHHEIPQIHVLWDVITCPCPWYLLLAQHSFWLCWSSKCGRARGICIQFELCYVLYSGIFHWY